MLSLRDTYLLCMRGERPPELMLSLNFKDCLGPSLPGPLILVRQRRLTLKVYRMKIIQLQEFKTFFLEVHMTQQTFQ